MGVPGHLLHLFREAPSKRRLLRSLALGARGGDRTVTSADGTHLSVRRSGDGVPVVLVHGTLDGISAFSLWNQLRDGVGATPRELEVVADVRWDRFDLPVRDRPVLVIRGDRDHPPAYPRPEDLPRFVTDAEVVTLPGQGHLAPTFAPARFAEVVLDFIDRH